MKKSLLILFSLLLITSLSAQEKQGKTKMDNFVSQTGTIIKFENYNLDKIKTSYGVAQAKIKKVIRGDENKFFYQIINGTTVKSGQGK